MWKFETSPVPFDSNKDKCHDPNHYIPDNIKLTTSNFSNYRTILLNNPKFRIIMAKSRKKKREKPKKKVTPRKKPKKTSQKRQSKSKSNDKEKIEVTKMRIKPREESIYEKFLDLDQIKDHLCGLAQKHPTRIDIKCIGQSAQGRPILMAYVTDGADSNQKNITMVEAGSNGSDFYSVSSALYLINFLIQNPNFTLLMDYIIIPCSNPDGYLYCLNDEGNGQVPVDLSHNFPLSHLGWSDLTRIKTDEFLTRIEAWKENYKFNAPESLAVNHVLRTYHVAIKLFISLQEGGQRIVFPFGCCDTKLQDEFEILKVAKSGAAGFRKRCISIGSIYNCCGLTFGSLIDFMKFEQSSIKFMYIIHLFKKGTHSPRVDKIKDYGEEVANCIRFMTKSVFILYNRNKVGPKCEE